MPQWWNGPYPKDVYQLLNVHQYEPLTIPWREEPAYLPRMPAYPDHDGGVILNVQPRWRKASRVLVGGGTIDIEAQIHALAQVACQQYYRALGVDCAIREDEISLHTISFSLDVDERPFWFGEAAGSPDVYPVTDVALFLNKRAALGESGHFFFCSYSSNNGEEFIQLHGWIDSWGVRHHGKWVSHAGAWRIPQKSLHAPNTYR